MKWINVLPLNNLPPETRQVVTIKGHKILLIHHAEEVYALDHMCPHMGLPLKEGPLTTEQKLLCPTRQMAFNLHTGKAERPPDAPSSVRQTAQRVPKLPLAVYPTRIADGAIYIKLNEL